MSLNLAIVLSQLGRRVLLVDADLRLPRLHRVLALSRSVGLSSYLSGNASLDELVQDTPIPNLMAIASGPIPPNPSELLGSPRLESLVRHFSDQHPFDCVVFDSSPILSVSDSLILASHLDATIVVARAGETARESLQQGVSRLRHARARLIGVVLNGVSRADQDYYYGRYGYGYVYGRPQTEAEGQELASAGASRSQRRFGGRARRA